MNLIKHISVLLFAITAITSFAQEKSKNDISLTDAAILGLVEGATEYLPVSSTGHLIITNAALGLNQETPVLDKNGLSLVKPSGEPYTIKALADSYAIVIQFGAIASVALIYWKYILQMLLGLLGKNPQGLKLFKNMIVAFLPAACIGLLINASIENILFGVWTVIIALIVGGVVMIFVQKIYDKQKNTQKTSIEDLKTSQALLIGVLQCVAMIPGTSRSMMTILGGYIVGMDAKNSATFSFLLGLITLSAAAMYKIIQDGEAMLTALSPSALLLGLVVAFVSSAITVKWLVGFLTKRGLVPFAIYRFIIAVILSALFWYNFI